MPTKRGAVQSRLWAAGVTGGVAFALLLLLLVPGDLASAIGMVIAALLAAALLAAWIIRRGGTPRSAWGIGCFIDGLLSAAAAIDFRVQDDLWLGRSHYAENVEHAIGPLAHFGWALAGRLGVVALVLAAVLLALSFWLLGPPHRKA